LPDIYNTENSGILSSLELPSFSGHFGCGLANNADYNYIVQMVDWCATFKENQ
jgi:hypothetical protein